MAQLASLIKRCGSLFGNWMAKQFFPEFKCLLQLAWPIIVMNLCRFINPTISMIMCGHLTKTDFEAASLANAIINVFGVSIDFGFSTACDTIFAQIYGSKNKAKLGIMLQRAIFVMIIIYFFLACFHLNIEPILIWLKQDVEISRLASRYVIIYLPGLFFDFQFLTLSRYLQNQNIVYPMMICAFIGCVFNTTFQYIGIYVLGMGIDTSAAVQAFTCFVMFILQLVYVLKTKVYKSTWQGFDLKGAFDGWGIFFKLGIPGIIMLGVEEWSFEIGNFLSGAMSDIQLGAQSIAFQIEITCYVIHSSLSIGVAIRAGQFLGANMPEKASLAAKVVLITDFCISICTATIMFTMRNILPYIFTNDESIRLLAAKILLIVGFIQFLDAGCSSTAGIFRACGRQLYGAVVMFISYYFIGVPIGIVLIFVAGMDIRGFWLGLLIGLIFEVTVYLTMVYRIDWNYEAHKAQLLCHESRASKGKLSESNSSDERADTGETISEKTKLIIEADEFPEYPDQRKRRFSVVSARRSISGVTDILADSLKEMQNINVTYQFGTSKIIKRIVLCATSVALFLTCILIRIYLPRGAFIPCIGMNSTLPLNKHYPFCNDTIYN